jgi:hypothetical protein
MLSFVISCKVSICLVKGVYVTFYAIFCYLVQGFYVTFNVIFVSRTRCLSLILCYLFFISHTVSMSHFMLSFYLAHGVYVTFYVIPFISYTFFCHSLCYFCFSYKVFKSHFMPSRTRCLGHFVCYFCVWYRVVMSNFVLSPVRNHTLWNIGYSICRCWWNVSTYKWKFTMGRLKSSLLSYRSVLIPAKQ